MWVFTSHGFISAVQHRDKPDHLMIRARRLEHLHALFPGEEVSQSDRADYRYRVTVPRAQLQDVMHRQIEGLRYHNFKNSIPDHRYHDACSRVWGVMHSIQPGSYMAGVEDDDTTLDPPDDLDDDNLDMFGR